MPPRLKAPESPELSRAISATQPEQADKKLPKKKKNRKHQPTTSVEAAQPQWGDDERAEQVEEQVAPARQMEEAMVEESAEKKKKKKKRQSEVQPEEPAQEDETIVEPSLEPKRKKMKKRQSEVQPLKETAIVAETLAEPMQTDKMVIDTAPERKKKKRKNLSEAPHVMKAPELIQEEDTVIHTAPDNKRKKKKRQSEAPPVEESVLQEVLAPEPIQEDAMDVDPVPEPKRKKNKKRQSEVPLVEEPVPQAIQEDEPVVDTAPERKQKKKKRHSELPGVVETTILEVPIVPEPIQDEDAIAEPSTEGKRKKKKKKRYSAVLDAHPAVESEEPEEPVAEAAKSVESMDETLPEPKPKKKKKRQSTVDEAQLVDMTTTLEELFPSLATHEEEAIIDSLLDPDRKKKKKMKRQETLPEGDLVDEPMVIDEPIAETVQAEVIVEASAERKKNKKRHSKVAKTQLVDETVEAEESARQDVLKATSSGIQEDAVILEAPAEKKRKKKRHSRTAEVQELEETCDVESLVSHAVQESVLQTVQEEEAAVEGSPKPERKKKKKKRHSIELGIQESIEISNLEDTVSGTFAQATQEEASVKALSTRGRKKKKKKQLGGSELQPVEETVVPEDDPASPAAMNSNKKRSRTEGHHQSSATSSKKQRKHSSPFEVDHQELELRDDERPSLLATHLNGDTSAVASLYQQRYERLSQEAQQTIPATQSTLGGDHLWSLAQEEAIKDPGHINGPSRRREESISTVSEADDHTMPISGEADNLDAQMDVDSVSSIPPLEADDIESVASDEVGRPLGNPSPSIQSDSEVVPADGSDGAEDVDMYDVGLPPYDGREAEEEEIAATPYPEPDRSSSVAPTHSRPTSQQDSGMPLPEPAVTDKAKSKRSRRKISEDKARPAPCPVDYDDHTTQEDEEMVDGAIASEDSTSSLPKSPSPKSRRIAHSEQADHVDSNEDGIDQTPAAGYSPLALPKKTPKARMSTKRKPKAPFFAQEDYAVGEMENGVVVKKNIEDENAEAVAELSASELARRSKSPRSKKDANPKKAVTPKTTSDGYYSGTYMPSEVVQIKTAVENFRLQEDLTRDELIGLIHTNPADKQKSARTGQLWTQLWPSVMEACPTRKRDSLIKWTRKQFHNYVARGAWTPEQDQELLELIKANPLGQESAQWTKIGSIINRHPDDCREHWRNKLIVVSTRKIDYWTEQEEQQLYDAIQAAIAKIRADGDKSVAEKSGEWIAKTLVNWQHISRVGMAGTRDNLQCRKKWNQLAKRHPIPEDIVELAPPGEEWRIEAAKKDLKRVTADDKVLLLQAIEAPKVFMDHKINWKRILENVFGNRFERMALQWTWWRLKQTLSNPEKFTTSQCARRLLEMYQREGNFVSVTESEEEDEQEDATDPSSARDRSATPGSAMKGFTTSKYQVYRKPRVVREAGGSNDTASTSEKKRSARKSSTQDENSNSGLSVRKTTARKTTQLSEEFVYGSDSDEIPESVQQEPDASLGEIPESVQGDPAASPRKPTQDFNEPDVLLTPIRRRERREPSVDLSFEASRTPALGSSKSQRTYGRKDRSVSKRPTSKLKVAMDLDEEQEASPVGEAGEDEEPSLTKKKKSKRKSKAVADSEAELEAPPVVETGDHEEPAASPAKKKSKRKSKAVVNFVEEEDSPREIAPTPVDEEEQAPQETESTPGQKKKSKRKSKVIADPDVEQEAPLPAEAGGHEEPALSPAKKKRSKRKPLDMVHSAVEAAPLEIPPTPSPANEEEEALRVVESTPVNEGEALREIEPTSARKKRSKRKSLTLVAGTETEAEQEAAPAVEPIPVVEAFPVVAASDLEVPVSSRETTLKHKPTVTFDSDKEQEDSLADEASDREEPVSSERASQRTSTAAIVDSSDDDEVFREIKIEPSLPLKAKTPSKRKRNLEEDFNSEDEQSRPSPSLSIDDDAARENLLSRSSKKRRTRTTLSPNWEVPVDRPLRAMSTISSDTDMNDLEDIPATLRNQNQGKGWR